MTDFDVENSKLSYRFVELVPRERVEMLLKEKSRSNPSGSRRVPEAQSAGSPTADAHSNAYKDIKRHILYSAEPLVGFNGLQDMRGFYCPKMWQRQTMTEEEERLYNMMRTVKLEIDIIRGAKQDPNPLRVMMNNVVSICKNGSRNNFTVPNVEDVQEVCSKMYPRFGFHAIDVSDSILENGCIPHERRRDEPPSKNITFFHINGLIIYISFF